MEINFSSHYEAEANGSSLVIDLPQEYPIVQYQMGMLEQNQLPHILTSRRYVRDGNTHLCYNVTAHIPLAQVVARKKLDKSEVLTLLGGITETLRELPEYQMPIKGLLLSEEWIFVRPGEFDPSLIYLPVWVDDDGLVSLREFVKDLVLNSRIGNTNDDFVQRLLELVNRSDLTTSVFGTELAKLRASSSPSAPIAERKPIPERVAPIPLKDLVQPAPVETADENHRNKSPRPLPPTEKPLPATQLKPAKKTKKAGKEVSSLSVDSPEGKKKTGTTKESLIFTAVQAIAILGVAFLFKSGFFASDGGGLNVSYIAGMAIALLGLDVVLYRELFINSKRKKENVQSKEKKAQATKVPISKPKSAPAPKPTYHPSASVASAHPAPAPIPPLATPAQQSGEPASNITPPPGVAPYPIYIPAAEDDGGDEATVVIDGGESGVGSGYLEYFENGLAMRIHLTPGILRVGSRAKLVDHVLASQKVSKVHAEFTCEDGRYFVRDINSTNGTYINGSKQRIVSNQNVELHDGDRVRLADVELTFRC